MSSDNPNITASNIVTDIENKLLSPGIGTAVYLPWISYAYQKTYQTLVGAGEQVKISLFGDETTFDLTAGVGEYTLTDKISRFGGFIKVEIKYGADGDDWERASNLESTAFWKIDSKNTTSERAKTEALYYKLGETIGFIPIPPSDETDQTPQAKIHYVKRPYQIDDGGDVIDIPYRFIYPINNYVQAKAIQRLNEDYVTSLQLEANFERELEQIAQAAVSEFSEDEQANFIRVPTESMLNTDPMR